MTGTILCSFHVITHLILKTALLDKYSFHSPIFDRWETEVLRGDVPHGHSYNLVESEFKSRQSGPKAHALITTLSHKDLDSNPSASAYHCCELVWTLTSESQFFYLSHRNNGTCLMPVASK